MKYAAFLASVLLSCPLFAGEEYRTWTQLGTKKTIEARLLEKGEDGQKVRIITRAGKAFWVEVANLSGADADYIAEWGVEKPNPIRILNAISNNEFTRAIQVEIEPIDGAVKFAVYDDNGGSPRLRSERPISPGENATWSGVANHSFHILVYDTKGSVIARYPAKEGK